MQGAVDGAAQYDAAEREEVRRRDDCCRRDGRIPCDGCRPGDSRIPRGSFNAWDLRGIPRASDSCIRRGSFFA
jgi:hypothetical protein